MLGGVLCSAAVLLDLDRGAASVYLIDVDRFHDISVSMTKSSMPCKNMEKIKGILATPPKATPPGNKGLIRPY